MELKGSDVFYDDNEQARFNVPPQMPADVAAGTSRAFITTADRVDEQAADLAQRPDFQPHEAADLRARASDLRVFGHAMRRASVVDIEE